MAQNSLQQQTKAITEDQKEQDGIIRRKFTVIVHGMAQPEGKSIDCEVAPDWQKMKVKCRACSMNWVVMMYW